MFDKTYEDRLVSWSAFRASLENSKDPIQDVIDRYRPNLKMTLFPVLGMCHSLQLTDCFNRSSFEIHITTDYKESASYYILIVDKYVIGYYNNSYTAIDNLPDSLVAQKIYIMPHRQ